MSETYNGKCPLCSSQLVENGDRLECVENDYTCLRADFERIWNEFDQLDQELRSPPVVDQLLADLQGLNLNRSAFSPN